MREMLDIAGQLLPRIVLSSSLRNVPAKMSTARLKSVSFPLSLRQAVLPMVAVRGVQEYCHLEVPNGFKVGVTVEQDIA